MDLLHVANQPVPPRRVTSLSLFQVLQNLKHLNSMKTKISFNYYFWFYHISNKMKLNWLTFGKNFNTIKIIYIALKHNLKYFIRFLLKQCPKGNSTNIGPVVSLNFFSFLIDPVVKIFQHFNVVFWFTLLFLESLPMWGLRAVTSIRDSFMSLLILSVLAWIPTTQFSVKDTDASPSSLAECSTFLI